MSDKQQLQNDDLDTRVKNSTKNLGVWTLLWVLSMALMTFGPKLLWDFNSTLSILGLLVNLFCGIKMLLANRRHLLRLDEMQRGIQLNAMALTLGVGLVVGLAYDVLEDIKLIDFEPSIAHLVILMAIVHIISLIMGNRKYQ